MGEAGEWFVRGGVSCLSLNEGLVRRMTQCFSSTYIPRMYPHCWSFIITILSCDRNTNPTTLLLYRNTQLDTNHHQGR